MRYMVAADTGGTFTDIAVYDAQTQGVVYGKALTNYADLVEGVLAGLEDTDVALDSTLLLKHGTTHVINTFLQRSGARTALVTTRGFRDTLEIGRGNRPVPFQLNYRRDPPLVPRNLRFELDERIDSRGSIVTPLSDEEVGRLAATLRAAGVEAVAISFLNAYANPVHEEQAAQLLKDLLPELYVTTGTSLTREWYEFERSSTAAANAYVGGRMQAYIERFDDRLRQKGFAGRFYMMGSNGGVLSVARTVKQPVALVESGPIGGCIGAASYARALGFDKVIAFDMGGTTAKCALVQAGQFDVQPIYYVNGYDHGFPLKTAVLDIVEVGAGGGSIASVDAQQRLTVGPRSAGSEPGPVAFGRGGTEPTVTDANLVLGRIGDSAFVGGRLKLQSERGCGVPSSTRSPRPWAIPARMRRTSPRKACWTWQRRRWPAPSRRSPSSAGSMRATSSCSCSAAADLCSAPSWRAACISRRSWCRRTPAISPRSECSSPVRG